MKGRTTEGDIGEVAKDVKETKKTGTEIDVEETRKVGIEIDVEETEKIGVEFDREKTDGKNKDKAGRERKRGFWNSRKFQNAGCIIGALLIVLSVMGELLLLCVMELDGDFYHYDLGDVMAEIMTTSGYTDSFLYEDAFLEEATMLALEMHAKALFETDGRYDENKTIDLAYVAMLNDGAPATGITYRIGDLIKWKHSDFQTRWLIPQQFDVIYEKKHKDPGAYVTYEELNEILMNAAGIFEQKECVSIELAFPTDGESLYIHAGDLTTLSEYTSYLSKLVMYVQGMYGRYANQAVEQSNIGIAVVNPSAGLLYSNFDEGTDALHVSADQQNSALYEYVTQKQYHAVYYFGRGLLSHGEDDIPLYGEALLRNIGLHEGDRLYLVLDGDFSEKDLIKRMGDWYGMIKDITVVMLDAFAAGVCLFLTAFIRRTMLEGRDKEQKPRLIGRWFTVFLPAIFIPLAMAVLITLHLLARLAECYWSYYEIGNEFGIYLSGGGMFGLCAAAVIVIVSIGLYFYLEVVSRIKTRTLFRKSLIGFTLQHLKKIGCWTLRKIRNLMEIVDGKIKWVVGYLAFLIVNLIGVLIAFSAHWFMLVLMGIADLAIGIAVFAYFKEQDVLRKHMEKTVQGSSGQPLETERFHGMNRRTAELVNDMDLGISRAVEKSVKDERMRTELIANVSHDVRTPLTSIINYVDLLKKEPMESENAQKYLQVLDEKSARLKQLTEDLVEASRITSGNVSAEAVHMSAAELVQQVAAEYEEKFNQRELELVLSLPDDRSEDSFIGDSRYVWRVLSNLFSNLCKYAMPHTRVYFSMYRTPTPTFCMELKNISEYPLNISPEELTERFVRGDASRGTEGNGLGLSIAQSLMNVMHGTLEIKIDGDLFKVILNFPVPAEGKA